MTAKKATRKKSTKKAPARTPRRSASATRAKGAARQKAMREAKQKPATPRKTKEAKPTPAKRTSLLDAAATVLGSAKEPMQAKQIVEQVVERGLWKPGAGKTPHATLYAAMTREINAKGKDARFRKVGRGKFTAA